MEGQELVRSLIGAVDLPDLPYVHSLSVTENYVVLVAYSLHFKPAAQSVAPAVEALTWKGDAPSTVYLFDAHSTDPNKGPVHSFTTDAFFSYHHVNAYEDRAGRVVLDVIGYYPYLC